MPGKIGASKAIAAVARHKTGDGSMSSGNTSPFKKL